MKILTIIGTRPEMIKMAPVIKKIENESGLTSVVCATGQHQAMFHQVSNFFDVDLSYDLEIMKQDQSLSDLNAKLFATLPEVIKQERPQLVLVHGDTATTFAGALVSFQLGVKVGHVEAGLRSGRMDSPWPEEANRKLTTVITNFHFAPTSSAKNHLLKEGVNENSVYVTGNTVIDALLETDKKIVTNSTLKRNLDQRYNFLNKYEKLILVTVHRRESFGKPIIEIANAVKELASINKNVSFVIPVHMNPNVRRPINQILSEVDNVFLIEPIDYPSFVYLMRKSYFLLTDSGGVQEEAPALGKPVLVMRDVTERPEGVKAGCLELIGAKRIDIFSNTKKLLNDHLKYKKMSIAKSPYGDGNAADRIIDIIKKADL